MSQKKHIVVTGGSGKLGRAIVDEFLAHGYDVTVVDHVAPAEKKCRVVLADLSDFGQALDALTNGTNEGGSHKPKAPDAIVHLSAIPAPRIATDAETYRNNTQSDYNVFESARRAGVKNVVWASSETVLGLPFETPPVYVPIDEDVPPRPESAYSLGKLVGETIAEQFCRWDPELKIVGLRFSNVMALEDYGQFPSFTSESRKWNLWGYIDARDAAQATRLSVEAKLKGAHVFIIANADTVLDRPNDELLKAHFPNVERKRDVGKYDTLLSIDKARRVLGYEPKHSWRTTKQPAPKGI